MLLIFITVQLLCSNCTVIKMLNLDISLSNVISLCMAVCSQVSLFNFVLKSPLRITHLKFLSEWCVNVSVCVCVNA